jgi:hypothetical protein
MVDYISLLVFVATVIFAYLSYRHQQQQITLLKEQIRQQEEELKQQADQLNQQKQQRRRELIEKYYPPLAENLRLSLPEASNKYYRGHITRNAPYFDVLIDMDNNSTLRIIEARNRRGMGSR